MYQFITLQAKSGSKCKNDHVSTAPSDETRSEDDLLSSPADSVTKHTATKETSSMDNVSTIVDKKIKVSEKTLNGRWWIILKKLIFLLIS